MKATNAQLRIEGQMMRRSERVVKRKRRVWTLSVQRDEKPPGTHVHQPVCGEKVRKMKEKVEMPQRAERDDTQFKT